MARSKCSQRAVAHEDKLKQRRDARHADRHGHDSDDVDLLSPAGTELASPSQGARTPTGTTPLGTSPKRQSKKSALPRDESVVKDKSIALASKRARSVLMVKLVLPVLRVCLTVPSSTDWPNITQCAWILKSPLLAAAPSTSSLPTPPPQCSALRTPSSLPTPPPQWPRTTSSLPTPPAPQGSAMPPRPP
eukprot:6457209-Amphidinium_carterae.2